MYIFIITAITATNITIFFFLKEKERTKKRNLNNHQLWVAIPVCGGDAGNLDAKFRNGTSAESRDGTPLPLQLP